MNLKSYLIGILAVAVLTYVARAVYSPSPPQLLSSKPLKPLKPCIILCTGWGGDGAPPVVGNLLATASLRDRIFVRVCCKNAPSRPPPNVTFVTQRQFAGLSLAVEQCLLGIENVQDDCLVMTVGATCDALYGWDTELEKLLSACPHKSVITHLPTNTKSSHFPCVERVGGRGIHCSYSPIQDASFPVRPVRVIHLTEQMSFGPLGRYRAAHARSPSHVTSDTLLSWQMHAHGWKYYTPTECVILNPASPASPASRSASHSDHHTKPDISWHVECGLEGVAARAYCSFADLKHGAEGGVTAGTRARLGVVDPSDGEECAAKYGSIARVRALLGEGYGWPKVLRMH